VDKETSLIQNAPNSLIPVCSVCFVHTLVYLGWNRCHASRNAERHKTLNGNDGLIIDAKYYPASGGTQVQYDKHNLLTL
jgi:hypothetical protein